MHLWLMYDSGDAKCNGIVNETAAKWDELIPVFDHNLIKIVIVLKLARKLITNIWLFWTHLSFISAIFAVVQHD